MIKKFSYVVLAAAIIVLIKTSGIIDLLFPGMF
jgi:hypothetical protein